MYFRSSHTLKEQDVNKYPDTNKGEAMHFLVDTGIYNDQRMYES